MKKITKLLTAIVILSLIGCGGSEEGVSKKNPFNLKSFNPYTDYGFKYAWHLRVVDPEIAAARNITNDSHINIFGAWNITRGKGVKVAVIDYDFNSDNSDLKPNVYATYDVATNTTHVKKFKDAHGTACASIIASPKNGIGIIGVAPEAQLILITADLSKEDQRIKAFKIAKEFGADVISCSWGFGLIDHKIPDALKNILKDLYQDNITVIFASGNNGLDLDKIDYEDESELPWVIGVGSSTEQNTKAKSSNYGDKIDILAPGGDKDGGIFCISKYYDSGYGYFHGTSAAAPVVAGVVALMLSVNPNLTPYQVRKILISTAQKIEKDKAKYDPISGFSHTHAYGKVDAYKAVREALNY